MEYLCTLIIFKWAQFHAFVCCLGLASKYSALHHPELKASAELWEGNSRPDSIISNSNRTFQHSHMLTSRQLEEVFAGKNLHTIQPGAGSAEQDWIISSSQAEYHLTLIIRWTLWSTWKVYDEETQTSASTSDESINGNGWVGRDLWARYSLLFPCWHCGERNNGQICPSHDTLILLQS